MIRYVRETTRGNQLWINNRICLYGESDGKSDKSDGKVTNVVEKVTK